MRTLIVAILLGQAQPSPREIAPEDFTRLQKAIRPQSGESPWREIAWMTSIRAAREKAAAEGMPILVFTAADGSPLART
jgi:hypothetical protein